jgi:phosphoribosylamine--glycine ligase
MMKEGLPYTGVLYVGIMATAQGPKVVEYNCRLGDPEAQVVLPLFGGDFLSLLEHAERGALSEYKGISQSSGSAAIVVLASEGYPGSYPTGLPVSGIEDAEATGAKVLHAGTKETDGNLVTAGGRVFGVVGVGDTLRQALHQAYEGVAKMQFKGVFYRKDIGQKGLARYGKD